MTSLPRSPLGRLVSRHAERAVKEALRDTRVVLVSGARQCGKNIRRDELEAIADVALRHDLWILSDEVWSDIVYQPHAHLIHGKPWTATSQHARSWRSPTPRTPPTARARSLRWQAPPPTSSARSG